jgi:DNA-binding NarL/FixJ family response regulator
MNSVAPLPLKNTSPTIAVLSTADNRETGMGDSAMAAQKAARTALIADDDELVRVALASVLKSELGFEHVIEVGSLDEALDRLGQGDPVGIALFDLAMPGMESAASLLAVRECFPDLRVAVVSSSSRRFDILLALSAGVHGYVPKMLGLKEITNAIRQIVSGSIYVPMSLADISAEQVPVSIGPMAPRHDPSSVDLPLTTRQREVLRLLVEGRTNKEIARALDLSLGTVKIHLTAVFRTLGVTTRAAAAAAGAKLLVG